MQDVITNSRSILSLLSGLIFLVFMGGVGAAILWRILYDKIDIGKLICEPDGKASVSRLQLLIFTFVVAISLFYIVVGSDSPKFPEIPAEILTLLGISASTSLVSKSMSGGAAPPPKQDPPKPPQPPIV